MLVMMLTGFLVLASTAPVYVGLGELFTSGTRTELSTLYSRVYEKVLSQRITVGLPVAAFSFLIGAFIQAFAVVVWPIWRGVKPSVPRWVLTALSLMVRPLWPEDAAQLIRETEGRYPLPGTQDYSRMQAYLARNPGFGAYVEWERFLHFFYEYTSYACALVCLHLLAYVAAFIVVGGLDAADRFGGSLAVVTALLGGFFFRAMQYHRAAHRQSLVLAWEETQRTALSRQE